MPPLASFPELDVPPLEDRYARQRLIASDWDQERLAKASMVVAGAGALGNEVLKGLALAGVGKILIVDFDRIEVSNLSRSVLFRETDIGRPKASTAAQALRELNPEISVRAMDGDLETDLGLGILRESDLVLGCLDSVYARWVLNRACRRAGTPWIDGGINATVGEICLYLPGDGPCYECGMTQQMWRQIHERRSCMLLPRTLPPRTIPTTSGMASVAAALQVNEALAFIHRSFLRESHIPESRPGGGVPGRTKVHGAHGENHLSPGETLFVSISPYSISRFTTEEKPECLAHETYVPSVFVDAGPDEMTVRELLDHVPQAVSLQLDFDVVCGWQCVNCGDPEAAPKQFHRPSLRSRTGSDAEARRRQNQFKSSTTARQGRNQNQHQKPTTKDTKGKTKDTKESQPQRPRSNTEKKGQKEPLRPEKILDNSSTEGTELDAGKLRASRIFTAGSLRTATQNTERDKVMRLSALSGLEAPCPQCQSGRTPELVHEIGRSGRLAGQSLQALGVPHRAILRTRTETGSCCVELTKTKEVAADFADKTRAR